MEVGALTREVREVDGKAVVVTDAKSVIADLLNMRAYAAEAESLLRDMGQLQKEIDIKRRGQTVPVAPGQTRLIEFDASKLSESDFAGRWGAFTNFRQRKIEIYPLEQNHGNAILVDTLKPEYDDEDCCFVFDLSKPVFGNPSFVNAFKTSPLFGGGSDGFHTSGAHAIDASLRFRVAFEIEISKNFWDHFKNVTSGTTSRHVTFFQLKSTWSYTSQLVLALMWDWTATDPCFRIARYGDTRIDGVKPWQTDEVEHNIPMRLGQRQLVEMDVQFDPAGKQSHTSIDIDGHKILRSDKVNCFPATQPGKTVGVRGFYFGGYFGSQPQIEFDEPITVKYSNFSCDVGEST
jgi:hypothetical protein